MQLTYDATEAAPPGAIDLLTEQVGQMAFLLHCAIRDARDWREHKMSVEPLLLSRATNLQLVPDALALLRE